MYSKRIESVLKKASVKPGDRILIKKGKESYEGILMPKPEVGGDPSDLIIKLKSGYNIGINTKNVKIKKLGAGKKLEVFPYAKIKSKAKESVSMIVTGGTISSRVSYETGGVKWLASPEQLFFIAPELGDIAKIRKIEKPFLIASENMSAEHWQKIARTAAKLLNSSDSGLIITHGTDTLHFTAAALSFMLKNLTKPVVLTYAQRSTDRGSTDSSLNLVCAAQVAKSDIAEVVLVGHGSENDDFCLINRGTKVRKMHTSRRDTFRPINDVPIGKVWPNGKIEVLNKNYRKTGNGKVLADTKFEEKIALIKAYPGSRPDVIDSLVAKKYKGIVIEVTGLGHVPTDESRYNWLPSIKRAIGKGVIIVAAAQTLYGRLDPLVYDPGRKLLNLGVIFCEDMLPEVAYIKLGFVLGHTKNPSKVKEMMLTNLAGEINKRISSQTFLY